MTGWGKDIDQKIGKKFFFLINSAMYIQNNRCKSRILDPSISDMLKEIVKETSVVWMEMCRVSRWKIKTKIAGNDLEHECELL